MIGQVEGLHDVADLLIHKGELALVLESLEEIEGLLPAKAGHHEGIPVCPWLPAGPASLCFVQSAQVGRDYLHADISPPAPKSAVKIIL